MEEIKKYWPIIVIGLGVLLLFLGMSGGSSGASGIGTAPATNLASLESANLSAAQLEDQFDLSRLSTLTSFYTQHEQDQNNLDLGLAEISAATKQAQINASSAQEIATINDNAAYSLASLQSSTANQVAQLASQTSIKNDQYQLAATQSQANAQSQGGLFGFVGSLLAGLGL